MNTPLKIGILGTGDIAYRAIETARNCEELELYAVASRTNERARAYAQQYSIPVYYGSYLELVQDPNVELVYVATPHSEHFSNCAMALEHGKHVLCEKSFTLNAIEAKALIRKAKEKHLYLAEAMWMRYQPAASAIRDFVFSGLIGDVTLLRTEYIKNIWERPRISTPALGGGALLDIGVYCINFCRAFFGTDIERTVTSARLDNGLDIQDTVQFYYRDGKLATAVFAANAAGGNYGTFFGTKGKIIVEGLNHLWSGVAYSKDDEVIGTCSIPTDINGYEFEFLEAAQAIRDGRIESTSMPLSETLAVMETMDCLRREWGVIFPQEKNNVRYADI